MTDDEILTLAARHNVLDQHDIQPRAEEVIAFARDLAGVVMAEVGDRPLLPAPGLDWRSAPRTPAPATLEHRQPVLPRDATPMSDSDLAPLS